MKRDRIANELVIPFVINTTYLTNTGILTANWDTFHGGANPTNMLLMATMSAWWRSVMITVKAGEPAGRSWDWGRSSQASSGKEMGLWWPTCGTAATLRTVY